MTRASLVLLALSTLAGCFHLDPYVWVDELPDEAYEQEPYRIHAGDNLYVSIWNQKDLTNEVRVRPDGHITLALVGDVQVAGLTPEDASAQIKRRLDGLVLNPVVAVDVREGKHAKVSVLGEVKAAGQYQLVDGDTVLHLIAKAGGLTEFAQPDAIFVVRQGLEHRRVRFSYDKLSRGSGRSLDFRLRDGDVIVVE